MVDSIVNGVTNTLGNFFDTLINYLQSIYSIITTFVGDALYLVTLATQAFDTIPHLQAIVIAPIAFSISATVVISIVKLIFGR